MKKVIALLILISITLPANAFFWHKKDKALEQELQGKGYAGNLPNIEDAGEKSKIKVSEPLIEPQQFKSPDELKPVPRDNPAFIDIIQKQDKTSQYANDINSIIPMLEKLYDCIDENESLQLFVSKAHLLTVNIDYLIEKYNGKPENYYESFRKLTEVNRYTKTLMTLRKEAVQYQRFIAYQESGSIYSAANIEQQLEYLKEEINTAILLLKEDVQS